jgi:hypothetical protein
MNAILMNQNKPGNLDNLKICFSPDFYKMDLFLQHVLYKVQEGKISRDKNDVILFIDSISDCYEKGFFLDKKSDQNLSKVLKK